MAEGGRIAAAGRNMLDFVLPPRCPGCGAITPEPHLFCQRCWSTLEFLGDPACESCGLPFAHAEAGAGDSGSRCGACLAEPPPLARMRAAVAYGDIARTVALRLKYGGRPGVAETIARQIERHLDATGAPPVLAPVPLHRWRIWRRGYNQAALIADALARRSGVETIPGLLERVRATPPLGRRNIAQRRETLRGAFRVARAHAEKVRGRRIILIDDVFTTGSTAHGCAKALRRAGAQSIELLCWARVVR